ADAPREGTEVGALLPAPANLHSHAFQRAMAGMTERRGPAGRDSFWTWRDLMYRFLDQLSPEDVEAIAALVQMEMLEAGYASVGEFHYLHHQADGAAYDDPAEMSGAICRAAALTGIGLTHLPVLYQVGGCDGRALGPGQVRFGCDINRYAALREAAAAQVAVLPPDAAIGVAPHSLRAVTKEGLASAARMAGDDPIHIHVAEQTAEVEELLSAYGARPVEWLMANADVGPHWCLIHLTQMTGDETTMVAQSGAVAGLCPITESNLGDGIFNGVDYAAQNGRFGVGSDSNIRISLTEELRTLEYSQRLRDRSRAALATEAASTGRVLYETAALGGAQALRRPAGMIAPGLWADLTALNTRALTLEGASGDALLDAWIFAADDSAVTDVWSAGRHVVQGGRHIARDGIEAAYRRVMRGLRDRL
ncbi:MAG: formimidoylglutamate deiminase, partial [Pseudomonadota bacterium]